MAKKEQEMYEGLPVIEASDRKALEKKLKNMETRPEKVVVRISSRVTKIKNKAFSIIDSWGFIEKTNDIATVLIPDSVTEIGNYAFTGCEGLTSIVIPNSVTKIGEYSFFRCPSLQNVSIPDSVTEIGSGAFCECTSLKAIDLPASVTIIGNGAFDECSELKSIVLPNTLTEISSNLFKKCTELSHIDIPGSVTTINNHAFANCTNLTSIVIPPSVTKIFFSAFLNCTGLKNIELSSNLKSIDMNTFSRCTSLTSITIPDSVTEILKEAFMDCTSLKNVTLPNSLTDIKDDAFPEGVNIIRREAQEEEVNISQKRIPMLKAHLCNIDFELTDDNIEAYRDTFDSATVVELWIDEASHIYIGGDLCDVLYDIRDKLNDEGIILKNVGKDYTLSYVDEYQLKNCKALKLDYEGELNLIGAATRALTGAEECNASPVDVTILVNLGDSYFVMENNCFREESTEEEFNKLWNS